MGAMKGNEAVPLGPSLAVIRKAKGFNQTRLAKHSKVREGTISTIEISRTGASRDTADALAATLDVPVESLALYLPDDKAFFDELLPDGDWPRTAGDWHGFIKDLVPALIGFTREQVAEKAAAA